MARRYVGQGNSDGEGVGNTIRFEIVLVGFQRVATAIGKRHVPNSNHVELLTDCPACICSWILLICPARVGRGTSEAKRHSAHAISHGNGW